MKNILLFIFCFIKTSLFAQSHIVPIYDPIPGAKLTINSLVAKTPLSISTGGGTDTVQCTTCITSGGGVSIPAGYIARGTGTSIYADSFFVTDTTKHWVVLNRTTPLGVFQIYPTFLGTVTTTSGNTAVTGTNTLFLSTFQPGDTIQYNSENRIVSSIASNTSITLTANAGSNNTNVAYNNPSATRGVLRVDENGKIYRYNRLFINSVPFWGMTSFGIDALQSNTGNNQATAFGYKALALATAPFGNTAIGWNALAANLTGGNNTAVGWSSLTLNTGASNTAVGYQTLDHNTGGARNVAVGTQSASANISGTDITAIGYQALTTNTGSNNTAVGSLALLNNTTGSEDVAIGVSVLSANKSGSQNVAIGSMRINRTGASNTAIGYRALDSITTTNNNTAIGWRAGATVANGLVDSSSSNSTYLGYDTRAQTTGQSNQTVIGYQTLGAGSNSTSIGNSSVTTTHINGKINVRASANLTGQTATNASVATYTTGAADSTFDIDGYLTATAVTGGTVKLSVTYTDESNTSRTIDFFSMGSAVAALAATGVSSFPVLSIRCKASTAITVSTTATATITYNVGATIIAIR